jgi:hypothetical protein
MRPGRILMPTGKNGEEKESGMGNESEGKKFNHDRVKRNKTDPVSTTM